MNNQGLLYQMPLYGMVSLPILARPFHPRRWGGSFFGFFSVIVYELIYL